jgi:hypothetical protein
LKRKSHLQSFLNCRSLNPRTSPELARLQEAERIAEMPRAQRSRSLRRTRLRVRKERSRRSLSPRLRRARSPQLSTQKVTRRPTQKLTQRRTQSVTLTLQELLRQKAVFQKLRVSISTSKIRELAQSTARTC